MIVKVPAKAMLFGEYGVLYGFPSVAITFYNYFFEIRLDIQPSEIPNVFVQSSFFAEGSIQFTLFEKPKESSLFFYHLLFPWKEELKAYSVLIEVVSSFSSSLGFGSSSALIAGCSYLLSQFFKTPPHDMWLKAQNSLRQIQGKGSGYDVAVQLGALFLGEKRDVRFWIYTSSSIGNNKIEEALNHKEISIEEDIFLKRIDYAIPLRFLSYPGDSSQLGCFVFSGLYSNTVKSLLQFEGEERKEHWAALHGEIAQDFIQNPTLENLSVLMKKSLSFAKEQELFKVSKEREDVFKTLDSLGILYKTMGSGYGDCLWVLASQGRLEKDALIPKHWISFSFD